MKPIFTGVATALVTPFCEDGIDFEALAGLLERQVAAGVGAVVLAGTTGESPTLTYEEYEKMIAFAKVRIGGRIPLIVGCGANCTARACELASIAERCGADGLLAVTPYYNKASNEGLYLHYKEITEASSLPVLVYNVPARTGFGLKVSQYRRLAELPGVQGVKEASGDLALLAALCSEFGERFAIYTGNDEQTVPSMRLGARGVISVCSNVDPGGMRELTDACLAGDFTKADRINSSFSVKFRSLFWEVNPIPVKYVLSSRGLCRPLWRLPLCPPADDTARKLDALWE